jgi:hypothetical protein
VSIKWTSFLIGAAVTLVILWVMNRKKATA